MQTLDEIMKQNFASLSFAEKLAIIRKGKPCPELPRLSTVHKNRNDSYRRHFSTAQYKSTEWLTGCEVRNKLFCWPCFLFSAEGTPWSKNGYDDLNHLTSSMQRHERSKTHIQAFMELKMFGREGLDVIINDQPDKTIAQHNETVSKNREILKRLIDAICFIGKQDLPFRNQDGGDNFNKGNYLEFLDALQVYDPVLEHHLRNSTISGGDQADPLSNNQESFDANSQELQNNLIQAISEIIVDEIKKEVTSASFAAILLEKNSSIILRYVLNGVVYERFVGFAEDKTSEGLFRQLVTTIEEYQLRYKLVAQSYDGASVMPGYLNLLQKKVIKVYPNAVYSHSYAHTLNLNLEQSLACIKDCIVFFQSIDGLCEFFSKSKVALEECVYKKLTTDADEKWDFTPKLVVHTLNNHRFEIIGFFEKIVNSPGDWDADTFVKSQGFLVFLKNPITIFILDVFSKIFVVLRDLLQMRTYDVAYCCTQIEQIKLKLGEDKEPPFDDTWCLPLGFIKEEVDEATTNKRLREDTETHRELYNEIYDNTLVHIETRLAALKTLVYFDLLSEKKYAILVDSKILDDLLNTLKDVYPKTFDLGRLKNELGVIYTSDEFQNKAVHEMLQFMIEHELTVCFKEAFKLGELILTIPATAPVDKSVSSLNRIHSWCRSSQREDRPFNLSLLSIEKELLTKVRKKVTFYDDVTEKLLQKKEIVDLMFKCNM